MEQQERPRARWPVALAAWLMPLAIAPLPVAHAQIVGQPPPVLAPSEPPLAASLAGNEPAPGNDVRLDEVESQLKKLLDADKVRKANAARQPSFKMGGQIQIDYLFIGQDSANRASVGDADDVFDFRRARLSASGRAFDVVEYAAGFDFALAGRPSFLDNYLAVTDLPVLGNVRVGHYFEPFSLERFTVNRNNTFAERSLADTFAPARNLGIMAHNTIGDDQIGTWAAGWFRANSNNFGDDFSSVGGHAFTTRLTRVFLFDDKADSRSFLHLGAAYTFRSEDQREVQFQSFPEARAGTPGPTGIPPFVDTGTINAQSDQRLGVELAFVHGPLYIQGEYIGTWVDQIGGPPLFVHGAYGFVSYFLTGEHRTYNKQAGAMDRVYPFENFFRVQTDNGIEGGCGAWEVAARWSFIDLDSQNIQGGTLHDITLTLNWHLNPYTRVRWEYIHALLDRAPVGDSFAQIFGMRFDMDF
jgi:phosphate-selective porin OprO and OprP